jgi:alanyl-tRNA synthetase
MADWFRDKVGSGVGVFATVQNDKPLLVATVTDDLIARGVRAGDLVREAARLVGGGGGGRPNLAQAGGRDVGKLPRRWPPYRGWWLRPCGSASTLRG